MKKLSYAIICCAGMATMSFATGHDKSIGFGFAIAGFVMTLITNEKEK